MNKATNIILVILLFFFMVIITGTNLQNIDLGLVSNRSIDEWAFFSVLDSMHTGFLNGNLLQFLSIHFFSYGFPYFFIGWLSSFSFLQGHMYDAVLFINREISLLWAVGYIVLSYRWVKKSTNSYLAGLICACLLLMQVGVWNESMRNHPDNMMSFFIVWLLMFMSGRDDFQNWKSIVPAALIFSLAISSKIQAFLFLPAVFIFLYWDSVELSLKQGSVVAVFKGMSIYKELFRRTLLFFLVVIPVFVLLNPFLIEEWGRDAFVNSFFRNMESNKTNHGSYIIPDLDAKLRMLSTYYFPTAVWLFMMGWGLVGAFLVGSSKKKRDILAIILCAIIVMLYLLTNVNKAWSHYYLTLFSILPIGFMLTYQKINLKTISGCFSIVTLVVAIGVLFSYSDAILIHANNKIKDDRVNVERSKKLEAMLEDKITFKSKVVISPYTPFRFDKIGLSYKNIKIIWGPLTEKYAQQGDVIVIRKDDNYYNEEYINADNPNAKLFANARKYLDSMTEGVNNKYIACGETPKEKVFCRKPIAN